MNHKEFKEIMKKIENTVREIVVDFNKDILLIEQEWGIKVCLSTSLEDLATDILGGKEKVAFIGIKFKEGGVK